MSLKRIAKELGLSLTTVSRAMNGYPEVAASTRRDVLEAAARMDYRADVRARGLALGRADAVGIVFPITTGDLGDQQFLQVASSMSERFALSGMDLLIVSASADDELAAYERAITGRHIGVFMVPRTRVHDQRLELLQANTNMLLGGIETVFLLGSHDHALTSSSLIKQIVALGGELETVERLVPAAVAQKLLEKIHSGTVHVQPNPAY